MQFLILACLLVLPWFFGGVLAQHWCWVFPLAAVMVLLDFFVRPRRVMTWRNSWPIWCGVLLGLLQLVRWSPAVADVVAPSAVSWRAEALMEGGSAATRSLYAPSTRETVGLLVLAGIFFQLSGRHLTLKAVCMAGTALGTVLSLFALVQQFTWQGELYWTFPITGGQVFGPYVNRNNAAGLLNMCLACSAGWLVLSRSAVGQVVNPSQESEGESGRLEKRRIGGRGSATRATTGSGRSVGSERFPTMLLAAACMGIMLAAIVASASRGGTLAAAAVLLTGLLVGLRTKTPTVFVGFVVLIGVGLLFVGLLDLQETLLMRWGKMADDGVRDGRLDNWQDSLKSVPSTWLWGSGLGCYRFPSRLFETHDNGELWYMFAENQYVQSLVDGGVVALGLLLAMIGLVAAAVVRLARRRTGSDVAVATLGAMVLAGQAVAGGFDFGLYHAANALWMATLCGVVLGLAGAHQDGEGVKDVQLPRWIGGGVLLTLLVVLGRDVYAAGAIDRTIRKLSQADVASTRKVDEVTEWLNRMYRVSSARPDDERAYNSMSELWSEQLRLGMLRRLRTLQPWGNEEAQYTASSPRELARLNLEMAANSPGAAATSPVVQDLLGLTSAAVAAVRSCPWDWRHQLRMAEVAAISKDLDVVQQSLRQAERVAGGSSLAWFECGMFYRWMGDRERRLACWARSLALSGRETRAIVRQMQPEDWEPLVAAAQATASNGWPLTPRTVVGLLVALRQEQRPDEMAQLLDLTRSWPSVEPSAALGELGFLAEIRWLAGQQEEALTLMRRAKSDPSLGIRWQIREIEMLIERGETEEAERQLQRGTAIPQRVRDRLRARIR